MNITYLCVCSHRHLEKAYKLAVEVGQKDLLMVFACTLYAQYVDRD